MKQIILLIIGLFLNLYFALAQNIVTGTVISGEDNQALIGATVTVKGTTTATQTDLDGKFSIKAQPDQSLIFSYVGFITAVLPINSQSVVDLVLKPEVTAIEQVIVAGVAANTPKRKVSISVEKVSARDLEAVPGTSAASALQGKVAGVTIISGGGSPGKGAGIRLRGSTSVIGDSKPLIIVDGVMLEGDMSDINVDDIASFEVVKGAASTALYGSKAGNGVIVVTTKRGGSSDDGHIDIRVRNEFGMQTLAKKIDLAEHNVYLLDNNYQQKFYTKYSGVTYPTDYKGGIDSRVSGSPKPDYDHYIDNPYSFNIDHQDELFQNGSFYTNYISLGSTLGKSKTKYFVSFENNRNSGIVLNTDGSKRQNMRVNLDQTLFDKLKIKTSTLVTKSNSDQADGASGSALSDNAAFYNLLFMAPDVDLNLSGPDTMTLKKYYYKPSPWGNEENPLHQLFYESNTLDKLSILQNFNIDYQATPWLSFNADYSLEKFVYNTKIVRPYGYQASSLRYYNGNVITSDEEGLSTNMQLTANFNKAFGELVTRGKVSMQQEQFNGSWAYKNDRDSAVKFAGIDPYNKEYEIVSRDFYAILDADYRDRYIFSALLRYDGSSLFGADARWNPYYRVSVAWRLNEELKIDNVQEIKLRSSLGTSGQRPRFHYQYETFVPVNNIIRPYNLGNKNLKPSQTREFEIGLEAEMFKRINFSMTWANNVTTGAYNNVPISGTTGYISQWLNAVDLDSRTFEASLGIEAIKQEKSNLKFNITFDNVVQKITDLKCPPFTTGPEINGAPANFRIAKDEPFGVMYGQRWLTSLDEMKNQLPDGYTIDNFTINSDGYVIEKGTEGTFKEKPIVYRKSAASDPEFVKIANMNPDFNVALNTSYSYKQWTMSMLMHWKQGGDIYNATKQYIYRENRHGEQDQYGKPENQKKATDYYQTFYNQGVINDYFVEDGTYLKIREVSVYYNLKVDKWNKFVKSMKFGVLGRNLLTLTKYTGWDPEVANGNDPSNYIIDIFNYPNFRTFTGTVEFKF